MGEGVRGMWPAHGGPVIGSLARRYAVCENDFMHRGDGVAAVLPFLGVSSLDFGPPRKGGLFFCPVARGSLGRRSRFNVWAEVGGDRGLRVQRKQRVIP